MDKTIVVGFVVAVTALSAIQAMRYRWDNRFWNLLFIINCTATVCCSAAAINLHIEGSYEKKVVATNGNVTTVLRNAFDNIMYVNKQGQTCYGIKLPDYKVFEAQCES